MYRVMVVDDEFTARKGLINTVDWRSLDCKVECEATDGIEACELLESNPVDIIVTDIKMPGMDGMKLAKFIHENRPSVKVIILTGYADFSYAQAAINYNVVDFVLKPVPVESITKALKKTTDLLRKTHEDMKMLKTLETTLNDNLLEIRVKYIQDLINGIPLENSNEKLNKLGLPLDRFILLAMEYDSKETECLPDLSENRQKSISALKNLVTLSFKDINHINVFVNSKILCTILSFESEDEPECMQIIFDICEKILDMIDSLSEIKLSIGISHMHNGPMEIKAAYHEAERALSQKFYNDTDTSIFIPYIKDCSPSDETAICKQIDLIMNNVEAGNCNNALQYLDEFLETQRVAKQPVENIKSICIQLCSLCIRLLANHNIQMSKIAENGDFAYKQILQSDSFNHLHKKIRSLVEATSTVLNSSERQSTFIIKKTKEYIMSNYNKNLNLQLISDFVHLNGSYLSRLFRKEAGMTIIEFITKTRIEKAMELLRLSNTQISEVASMVGIDDPAYFSQIFKKYTNQSPKEFKYREIMKEA